MKTLRKITLATAISATLLGAGGVMAEQQGSLGSTSTGNFDIFLSVGSNIQIWGFQDLYLTGDGASPAMPLCVKNTGSTDVRFKVEGAFILGSPASDGGTAGADYSVTITDGATPSVWGSGQLASDVYSTNDYATADSTEAVDDSSCADGSTYNAADLTVDVSNTIGSGVFSDTVTVTVFPI